MPVYNVGKYLKQCLDALVNQNYTFYEVILVDDGSTDNCGEVCDSYEKAYPDVVRVIHQPNTGLIMARRTGIRNAIGEYFVFVDSDDFVETNLLLSLDKIVEAYHPDMILYGATYYDGSKFLPYYHPLYQESRLVNNKRKYYEATLKHTISNGLWGKAVNRKVVDIEKDYSEFSNVTIGEDLLQSLPYITNSKTVYFMNDCLYHYRINPESMAHNFKNDRYESLRTVELELNKYAIKWEVNNRKELIAYHAMKETVLGTLLTYAKSKNRLFTHETKRLIRRIKGDRFMKNQYININKHMFSKVQNTLLELVFSWGGVLPLLLCLCS